MAQKNNLKANVQTRVSPTEYFLIAAEALDAGLTVSDYLRTRLGLPITARRYAQWKFTENMKPLEGRQEATNA